MLAFPDSNSFSDNENTFKYTFKYFDSEIEWVMGYLGILALNRRRILLIQEDLVKDLWSYYPNCHSFISFKKWQNLLFLRLLTPKILQIWSLYLKIFASKFHNGLTRLLELLIHFQFFNISYKYKFLTICQKLKGFIPVSLIKKIKKIRFQKNSKIQINNST